jgi:endonuclease/exonuclease/phosphatase family metal-dependent hydrolase
MTMHELGIATLNLENGERIDLLPELVAQVPGLDVLMLQEGRGWDCLGQKRRFQAESLLAAMGLDRSFLTRSTRGTLHELVFIRSASMRPLAHYTPDLPDVFHDQIGAVELLAGGLMAPLTVRSVQWPHWSGDARLNEALRLTRYGAPDACAVIAGDFNSLYPDCETHAAEFEPDWTQLPPYKRHHKTLPPGLRAPGTLVSDRRAFTTLAEAGLQSAGCIAGDMTPTVNTKTDHGQGGRIDHILLSPMLACAVVPGSYQVHVSDAGNEASDHRMVSVRLDLTRVQSSPMRAGR